MQKVIITGCGGYIGGALSQRLLNDGLIVYGIDINDDLLRKFNHYNNFIPIVADFSSYCHLNDMLKDDIDVFYHFAWEGGFVREKLKEYELQMKNAIASCDAVKSAVSLKCKKFVYAGTVNEVEIHQFINNFAEFTTRPTCIYASAKMAAELMGRTIAQENKLCYTAGLIPMIYGEGNRSKQMFNIVLNSLLSGRAPDLIQGNNLYDLVYIDDVVEAFKLIGESGNDGHRYYIGHRKLTTFRQWVERIRDIISPDTELNFGKYNDPLNLDYSLLDLDLLYHDTGFICKANFEDSVIRTAKWLENLNVK